MAGSSVVSWERLNSEQALLIQILFTKIILPFTAPVEATRHKYAICAAKVVLIAQRYSDRKFGIFDAFEVVINASMFVFAYCLWVIKDRLRSSVYEDVDANTLASRHTRQIL
jgi:hypothetical protein